MRLGDEHIGVLRDERGVAHIFILVAIGAFVFLAFMVCILYTKSLAIEQEVSDTYTRIEKLERRIETLEHVALVESKK